MVKDVTIYESEKEKTFMIYLLPRELPDVSIEEVKSRHMFQSDIRFKVGWVILGSRMDFEGKLSVSWGEWIKKKRKEGEGW